MPIIKQDALVGNAVLNNCTLNLGSEESYVAHFFSIFLPQNTFSQRLTASLSAIQSNLVQHKSMLDVVAAIGALHCTVEGPSNSRSLARDALCLYGDAIKALRSEIARAKQEDLSSLLWSSYLLGLFEVGRGNILTSFGSWC